MKIRETLSRNDNTFRFRNISHGKRVLFRFLLYSAKPSPSSPYPSIFLLCSVLPFLLGGYPVSHLYRILRKHTYKRPYEN